MSRRNPKITIDGPAPISNAAMGFDGEHFFVEINGVVIAKRGLGEFTYGDESRETMIGCGAGLASNQVGLLLKPTGRSDPAPVTCTSNMTHPDRRPCNEPGSRCDRR
jgi:hypothetical protein